MINNASGFSVEFSMEVYFDDPAIYESLMEGEARLQEWIKDVILPMIERAAQGK